jgi:hypothetical protein
MPRQSSWFIASGRARVESRPTGGSWVMEHDADVHRLNSSSEFAYISENIIAIQDSLDYMSKNPQLCFCPKILRHQCFTVHHSNYDWFTL